MTGSALARSAELLVGCRFKLHGRDPATGLDCVGLVSAALAAAGMPGAVPNGYSLRTGHWPDLDRWMARLGLKPAAFPPVSGDVGLFQPSPCQMHFAIAASAPGRWVEAHASLGRVVITAIQTPCVALWRCIDPES